MFPISFLVYLQPGSDKIATKIDHKKNELKEAKIATLLRNHLKTWELCLI